MVNKGDNDRVRPGMTVVDSSGYLVGRVSRVDADKASILLITDKIMAVNVSSQRYDKSQKVTINEPGDGTAAGQGNKLIMQRIKPTADIKAEDWVFTNGLGGNYPPNILVGYVEKVISQEGQPDKQAEIRPSADLERLRRVQIIVDAREE
jgi:rod shape-determining protein MreC